MQKVSRKLSAVVGTLALLVLSCTPALALSPAALAHEADTMPSDATTTDRGTKTETTESTTENTKGSDKDAERLAAQQRLANAKLKVCQNREHAIDNILGRIADRGQKQLDLFTTIANRVETFYTNKGKTLSNYDTLVADVNAKKAAAQATVDTIKSQSTTFNCESSNPQGSLNTFKTSLKAEISALKEYRTAVRNLIVGVKSVQGKTSSAENQSGGNQ